MSEINKSVIKALQIIECFNSDDTELSLAELCRRTGISKAAAHRLISSLASRGFLEQNPETHKYYIGAVAFQIGMRCLRADYLKQRVTVYLEELMRLTGETSHFGVLDMVEKVAIQLHNVECNRPVRVAVRDGTRVPLHCTAIGKVLLAWMEPDLMESIIRRLEFRKYTDATITDPNEFRKHLEIVRKQGYALNCCEGNEGVMCISAPVFDVRNEVIGGLGISGNYQDLYLRMSELIEVVTEIASNFSKSIGYKGSELRVKANIV
ncbi:MAG: IclR family transcriptional regulator [Firmicutes bacterium]|nr:IclR family transcriptional regulator [Bacillota bacterium]